MSISRLAASINESPTLSLSEKAGLLRAKGEPVVHLGIGEPKNPAPAGAISASIEKLNSGMVKYGPTSGAPSLKKAIIQYTEKNYGRQIEPGNINVTTGAKQSLFNILYTILDPTDEVILLAPYWVSYPEMIKIANGIPVVVNPDNGTFVPSLSEIEKAVSSKTKAIFLNSPNNPSGVVYPESLVASLVEFCERNKIYLITDDIYHKLVFDGIESPPAYRFTDKNIENSKIIVVNGVSKLYGMTGFRIGWTLANKQLVSTMTKIQSQITSCPSIISQAAAEGALSGDQGVVEELRANIQNNRDVVMQEMQNFSNVAIFPPSGTFYALPDFSAYDQNSSKLAEFILNKALVVTVPGSAFGMEGHLRLSYAGDKGDIIEGIKRMRWALDPNAAADIVIGEKKLTRDWI